MAVTLNASTSSGFVQSADTSGEIVLQNNGTTRLTVNASGVTIPTLTTTTVTGTIVQGTAVASTSGTSIDFTSIPSWVKRVTVMFNGVSTNGTSALLIQLGDSGGVESTGYLSNSLLIGVSAAQSTAGFIFQSLAAANLVTGQMIFSLSDTSNTWISTGMFFINQSGTYYTLNNTGSKQLSAVLDRIRITTVGGTDAFDAGTINIQYEG